MSPSSTTSHAPLIASVRSMVDSVYVCIYSYVYLHRFYRELFYICVYTYIPLFHLSLHIMLKIWTNQKIVVSPFICCCFGLCLNHSIDATDC